MRVIVMTSERWYDIFNEPVDIYPKQVNCGRCKVDHVYRTFDLSQLALLKNVIKGDRGRVVKGIMKQIKEFHDYTKTDCYSGRFRCVHCNNEYVALEISDSESMYMQQVIEKQDGGSELLRILKDDPIRQSEHQIDCLIENIESGANIHIRSEKRRK
jgi:hypothetical protein